MMSEDDEPADLKDIVRKIRSSKLPPVHEWAPEREGEIDIRIARDGTWYYRGSPIERHAMVRLFSTILRYDDDGRYHLVTPAEKLAIEVEDAPFVAVEMRHEGEGRDRVVSFRTNVDEYVIVDADHPVRFDIDATTGEPAPYVRVRDRLEALIARSVYYDLVEIASEEEVGGRKVLGLWSSGRFFPFEDGAAGAEGQTAERGA